MTSRLMTCWVLVCFASVVCGLAIGLDAGGIRYQQKVPAAAPGQGLTAEEQAKQLVVMIRGKMGDAPTTGAGIIIGIDQDRIYIATANHVVRQGPQTEITGLEVLLKWLPGDWTPARLLADFDSDADLAVIAVLGARGLVSGRRLLFDRLAATDVKRTDQVFTIGYPAGQQWLTRVTPDIVSEVTSERVAFETTFLQPGHSGGALVNSNWEIVGLLKQDQPPLGVAIRMDRAIEQLTRWGYRVSLTKRSATTEEPSRPSIPSGPPGDARPKEPLVTPALPNQIGWPMFGRDEFHTNWNRDETVLRPPLKLQRQIGVPGLSIDGLSGADGLLFAGGMRTADNRNQAAGIDAASGRTQWTYALDGSGAMGVTPAYVEGRVFVGGQGDDNIYGLAASNGQVNWRLAGVGNLYTRHPVVRGQTLYYLTDDALVATDVRTGRIQWRYPIRSKQTSPVFCGSLLVVLAEAGTRGTALLQIIAPNGTPQRSWEVPASPIAYPTVWQRSPEGPGGRPQWIIGVSSGQQLSAYPVIGDAPLWTTRLPGESELSETRLAYANGLVIVGIWKTALSGGVGFLYAVDSETGKPAWRFSTGGEGVFGPVVANDVVYTAGWRNARIFALDLKSGRELWNADLPSPPTANPIVAYGLLFVPAGNTIYVFGP